VRRRVMVAAVVVLGLSAAGAMALILQPEPRLLSCVERGIIGGVAPCDFFRTDRTLMGHRTSAERAIHLARHPLYLPERLPAALEGERPEFWAADRQVGVRYRSGSESGLVVFFALWPSGRDPAEFYCRAPDEWGAGETTTIGDRPAWVIPNASGWTAPPNLAVLNVSAVHVTIDRTEVTLFGRVLVGELVDAAESLRRLT
jgi:hypothetical protein